MLTPDDIKKMEFQKTPMGGYKSTDVDAFISSVFSSYEQLYNENQEYAKKMEILADKVEEYRNDEDNIRLALLTSQRMADKIIKEANEVSRRIIKEADAKRDLLLNDADRQAEDVASKSKEESEKIITSARNIYDREVEKATAESEQIISDAEKKSEEIIESATKESEIKLISIKRELAHETRALDRMQREVTVFRARLMSTYKSHVELINALPSFDFDDEKSDANTYKEDELDLQKPANEVFNNYKNPEDYEDSKDIDDYDQQSFEDIKDVSGEEYEDNDYEEINFNDEGSHSSAHESPDNKDAMDDMEISREIDLKNMGFTVVLPDDMGSDASSVNRMRDNQEFEEFKYSDLS